MTRTEQVDTFYRSGYNASDMRMTTSISELPYQDEVLLSAYHKGYVDSMIDNGLEGTPQFELYTSIFCD